MLDIPVAEICLNSSGIATIIGQMKSTSMAKHMQVNPELTEIGQAFSNSPLTAFVGRCGTRHPRTSSCAFWLRH
jgi:hypothetical protein